MPRRRSEAKETHQYQRWDRKITCSQSRASYAKSLICVLYIYPMVIPLVKTKISWFLHPKYYCQITTWLRLLRTGMPNKLQRRGLQRDLQSLCTPIWMLFAFFRHVIWDACNIFKLLSYSSEVNILILYKINWNLKYSEILIACMISSYYVISREFNI